MCDWDCCKHHDQETGECTNPEEVKLTTVEAKVGLQNKFELLTCGSFVDFEEGEAK
jgi:hypothetical protein